MPSSYLETSTGDEHDVVWDAAGKGFFLEVKRSNNVRDVRDGLLALAYRLQQLRATDPRSPRAGALILESEKLSQERLAAELEQFRQVVSSDLVRRLHLLLRDSEGRLRSVRRQDEPSSIDLDGLEHHLRESAIAQVPVSRVSRASVISLLVEIWITSRSTVSLSELQRRSGASYPTVVAARKELEVLGLLVDEAGLGFRLRAPTWGDWVRLAETRARGRRVRRYVDPTGFSSSERLLKKARSLYPQDQQPRAVQFGIGGVAGAAMWYPDINISSAPRLDLCVSRGTDGLAETLDAGLVRSDDARDKAVLVLHETTNLRELASSAAVGPQEAASAFDCLADLLDLGYQAEARDFAHALESREGVVGLSPGGPA